MDDAFTACTLLLLDYDTSSISWFLRSLPHFLSAFVALFSLRFLFVDEKIGNDRLVYCNGIVKYGYTPTPAAWGVGGGGWGVAAAEVSIGCMRCMNHDAWHMCRCSPGE